MLGSPGSPGPKPMGTSFGLRHKPIPKRCPTTWNYPKKLSSGCLYSCCLMSFPRSQEHGSRARYAWDGLCTCEHGGGTMDSLKKGSKRPEQNKHVGHLGTWVILYPYIHILYIYILYIHFTHLYFYCCTAVWRYQQVLTQPGVWTRSCRCLSFFHGDWTIIYRGYNVQFFLILSISHDVTVHHLLVESLLNPSISLCTRRPASFLDKSPHQVNLDPLIVGDERPALQSRPGLVVGTGGDNLQ